MRSCLAAIDFNENVDRPAKTSKEGDVCFREKVSESNAIKCKLWILDPGL